jgi:hypothetical protein
MSNMKPEFAFQNRKKQLEEIRVKLSRYFKGGHHLDDLPQYIDEKFKNIESTLVGTNWSIKNPNMEAQYVYERLTVFRDQLKELEEVAKKPEHHNLINKALIQVDEWQKYLIDTEIINQSKRYFTDDILHGSDKNPPFAPQKKQPPANKTQKNMMLSGKKFEQQKAHILELADKMHQVDVITKKGYCSSKFISSQEVRKYIKDHRIKPGTVKSWVKRHYKKKS